MRHKFFRKYLPSRDALIGHPYLSRFGAVLGHHNLWHLHRRSVAGGVAVGLLCGMIPGPVQMIGAALLAILLRVNLPVAVFTTFYTNPLTIVPLYLAAYEIGAFIIGGNNAMPHGHFSLTDKPLHEWLPALWQWITSLGKPLLLGLPLLAILLAAAGYLAVRGAWRLHVVYEWRKRAKRRHS
ncbi:MAG: DUF2062 domain-containing protein [Pseudomonadota bacterium]